MQLGPTLSSSHNPTVRYARSLHQKRMRYQERALLVEGVRLFTDCVAAGASPRLILIDEARIDGILPQIERVAPDSELYPVTSRVLDLVSDTDTPQGLIAILPFPNLTLDPHRIGEPLLLVADTVRDPGNLGTLIRAALGAGAHAVFIPPETVDPFSPKVMRAGMSAQYRIPILPLDWTRLDPTLRDTPQRLAAEASAETAYDQVDWTGPSCLIVGNEAHGLSSEAQAHATGDISIPLAGGLESLNVAVAGSVILFEAARQRRNTLRT